MINIRLLLLMLICAFAAMKSGMAQFQYHYEEYNPDYTFALSSTDNTISCEANTAGDVITLGQQKESASLSGLFYVQKSDENGIIEWAYNYQNFLIDHSKNIVAVDGVGYALVGWAFTGSNLPSPQVGTILMIDEDGKVLWARRFGEQKTRFEDVVYLPGVQEIHAIGYTQDEPSSSKTKGLIVKYDLNGTYLDDIAYEVPGSSVKGLGYDISVEYFGGDTYKIVERVETNSSTPSVLQLTSWDAFGFVSAHQYLVQGGDKDVWPYAIYPTNTGGFVVSGVLYRLANLGNPIYTGGFLMNVDVNGNVLWTHSFVDPVNFSNPNHAKIFYDLTTDGQDIYVVGLNRDPSLSGSVSEHPMVAKFDPSGNFLWGEIHGSLLRNRSYKSIFQSSINPDLYFSGFDHWGPANSRLMMTRMPITGSTGNGTCQVSFQLTRLVEITDQTSVSVNTSKVNLSINTNYQRGFSLIDHADCSTPNLRKASTLTIKSSSKELRIYPNPASQKLNFQMDESSIRSIKLFDTQGKLVKSYLPVSKNNFVALDVSKLPKGLYMVEVTNEDKILHSKVLIE